jgi:hypothetical protein
VPADLRPPGPSRHRACRLGDELGAEAEPEQRHAALQQPPQERLLASQPGVRGLFADVHRAAEGEDGVVAERVGRRGIALRQHPLVELVAAVADRLGEDARAGVALLDDREDSHAGQSPT